MRRGRGWALMAVVGIALVTARTAGATTYQVGPTRTYKTFSAVPTLRPGDIVEVDGAATYPPVVFSDSGTTAQKITVRGIPVGGQRPIISGGSNTVEVQADHFVLDGFDITGGSARCFFHHADDVTLRNSVVHDCPQQGILGADADSGSLTMEYDEVYRCAPPGSMLQHQIYMATDEVAHPGSVFRMQFCYVHDGLGGNNVKSRAERNEIYYNWIEGGYYRELELIGPDLADSSATESTAREDSDVVGNVLRKTGTNAAFFVARLGGDGAGQTNGRYRFVNNTIIVTSTSAVFQLFDGIESIEMHDNVFYRAGGGGVRVLDDSSVVWSTGSAAIAGVDNWTMSGSTSVPTQWIGTMTGADPVWVAPILDLRPGAGSPLIDAGVTPPPTMASHPFPSPLATPAFVPSPALLPVGSAVPRPTNGPIDVGAFEVGTLLGGSGGSSGAAGAGGGAGAGGAGGSSGTGGSSGVGGLSDTGGSSGAGGSTGGGASGSCSCAASSSGGQSVGGVLMVLALVITSRHRRARSRR